MHFDEIPEHLFALGIIAVNVSSSTTVFLSLDV